MRYLSFLFLKVAFSYICILSINTKATFAASCSIHEVESNIRNFSRNDQSITNATIKCGAIAIEPLKKALASNNERIRSNAAYALGGLGANEKLLEQTQSVVRQLVQGLKQEKSPSVRTRITKALGNIGNEAKIAVIDLLDLLSQDTASQVRAGAASALGSIQTDKEKIVPALIQALNDVDNEVQDQAAQSLGRWSSELKLENKDVIRALIPLLKDDNDIVRLSAAISLGKLADITYDESKTLTEVRHAIEEMTTMEKSLSIQEFDGLRSPVSRNLRALRDTQRSLTQEIVLEFLSSSKNIILIHSAIWLLLIFAYPKFPQIQAIFFWNPWMRKFFGAGYVGFVLTWVPFFRKKLFEPFRESLLSDADLPNFNSQTYFPSLTVKRLGIEEPEPIQIAIPQLKGQIILEGDSGLGKTMFLRCLCKQSNRVVVYLSARRCQDGVIEAIQ
jgi:hypothetical protein